MKPGKTVLSTNGIIKPSGRSSPENGVTAETSGNPARSNARLYLRTVLSFLLLAGFNSNLAAQPGQGVIVEFDLSRIDFDEEVFRGDNTHVGLTLAYAFNPTYEIGFSFNDNLIFSPSLDGGRELDELEDVETESRLFYLRRYWSVGDKTTAFGLIGYAKTEVKSELTSVCFFFCGGFATFNSRTLYRNQESGYAWGIGIQQQVTTTGSWSIKYIDYSDSDSEFTGLHFGLRRIYG